MNSDNINSPKHYMQGNKETIDIMADLLSPSEFKGYIKGNIIKYISRYKFKGGIEDLKKAKWYLNKLIEVEETVRITNVMTLSEEQFDNLCKLP